VADYSETLEVYLTPTDGISDYLYISQSAVCEMVTVQERARCVGWLFRDMLQLYAVTQIEHLQPHISLQ
jgi:hypothetical protein